MNTNVFNYEYYFVILTSSNLPFVRKYKEKHVFFFVFLSLIS